MHHGAKLHVVNIDLYPEACICVGCVAAGCEGFASMLLLQGHQNSVCTWQFQAQEPFLLQVVSLACHANARLECSFHEALAKLWLMPET